LLFVVTVFLLVFGYGFSALADSFERLAAGLEDEPLQNPLTHTRLRRLPSTLIHREHDFFRGDGIVEHPQRQAEDYLRGLVVELPEPLRLPGLHSQQVALPAIFVSDPALRTCKN